MRRRAFESFEWRTGGDITEEALALDEAIRGLNSVCQMRGGTIQLEFLTEPSFLRTLALWGNSHQVVFQRMGAGHPLHIDALGIRSMRKVFLGGQPQETAYFHHLRIHPEARGGSSLGRGYRAILQEADKKPAVATFTAILKDNRAAISVLENEKGRGALPCYVKFCDFFTCFIPLKGPGTRWPLRRRELPVISPPVIRPLGVSDLAAFRSLVQKFGDVHDGAANVPWAEISGDHSAVFPDLRLSDFLGLFHHNELLAAVGLWDQSSFKQYRLIGSGTWLDRLQSILGLAAGPLGFEEFPGPGQTIPSVLLDPWFVKPGKEEFLGPLLKEALARLTASPALFAAWGFPGEHPVARFRTLFYHLSYESTLYQVAWEAHPLWKITEGRRPFAHLGFL